SELSYAIAVRAGEVVRAECDDRALPASLQRWYNLRSILNGVGRFLEQDAHAGGWRMYNVASFDSNDGRLLHYVRSSVRSRERIEFILIRLEPVEQPSPMP